MRALKTSAALCAAATLIAGCGSSSSSASKQTPTVALQRAAYVSSSAPGYKALLHLSETVPGAGQVTINGTGTFTLTPKREGSLNMHIAVPGVVGARVGTLQMLAVYVPGTIYMKLPPQFAGRIPGGKPWLSINLDQVGKAAGIPGVSSLLNGSSSLNNPGQYLAFLRATANGSVKNVGSATVDGIGTTHYHALIDLSKLPNAVPPASRAGVQQLVAALRSRGGTAQMPIDAWIDSAQHIRRVVIAYAQPVTGGRAANVNLRMDFTEYGPQPAPAVPPARQTQNLLALLGGHP